MTRTEIYSQELLEDSDDGDAAEGDSMEEDERTLRLFDGLLQEEEDIGPGLFEDIEEEDDSADDDDDDDDDDEDGEDLGQGLGVDDRHEDDDVELENAFVAHHRVARVGHPC